MTKGKSFENFIENLEKLLIQNPSTTLLANTQLTNKQGVSRQIDVLLTHKVDRHTFRTIIECKNWKRKVDIKVLDEFVTKVKSVDVEKGIIVSKSGFTSGLLNQAKEYNNISLYSIDNVEDIRNEILDFHKVGIYTITYYSNDWTVKFFEKKPINDNIKLYTKLKFVDSIEEFDITDIAQDYLKANKDFIIQKILKETLNSKNLIEADLILDINLKKAAIYEFEQNHTFIIGFKSILKTTLSLNTVDIESVSKYQNLTENKTIAVILNLNLDEKTRKLMLANST